jgi:putative holliday junction resolvase
MGRILAIDYGTKRTGIAVTDPLQMFASPLETVATSEIETFLENYLKKEEVEAFVVGYPMQMNNTPSQAVKHINPFIKKLRKKYPETPVHLADERFTSRMALRTMIEGGVRKKDRQDKSMVDRISASIMLQSFLDSGKTKSGK